MSANAANAGAVRCTLCGAIASEVCAVIDRRPGGEVDYGVLPEAYSRRILRCGRCRVYFNSHALLPETFYSGNYNQAAYGDRFRARYDTIMALPPERSDNKQRVVRLDDFLRRSGRLPDSTRVLDIGCGLGVFAAELLKRGYAVHVVDPDPLSVRHALDVVGVSGATQGSLGAMPRLASFDLVTLNKVLEHVADPQYALESARELVAPRGYLYVELPDGEAAAAAGGFVDRSEFFVEHYTAYGPDSLQWLLSNGGLRSVETGRIVEPSGKCTIFAVAERST